MLVNLKQQSSVPQPMERRVGAVSQYVPFGRIGFTLLGVLLNCMSNAKSRRGLRSVLIGREIDVCLCKDDLAIHPEAR